MKSKKLEKKLNLNKLTIAGLDKVKAGRIPPTLVQYTCPGWTVCPYNAC